MAAQFNKELLFLVHQFFGEEKYTETLQSFEKDSGIYFNMKYFEEAVMNGNWDEAEGYLSKFTKIDENGYSLKTFFEIRKQKYLEALDKHAHGEAVEVLLNDLKVFAALKDLYKEFACLITLNDMRENEKLSSYADTMAARSDMFDGVKMLIEENPKIKDKLQLPTINIARLRTLVNQSLNWQHHLCQNPEHNPEIKTLYMDHSCGEASNAQASNQQIQPAGQAPPVLVILDDDENMEPQQAASGEPTDATGSGQVPVNNVPMNIVPVDFLAANQASSSYSSDDLPHTVIANLNEGSTVRTMDFHPGLPTLLLVGTTNGNFSLWEVVRRERIVYIPFFIWDLQNCSSILQKSLANEFFASVNRVIWSPLGTMFAVAYSKHIVHVYYYYGEDDLRKHLEIDAHVGSVNDIAFCRPDQQLCIITCGEDKTIKVWHGIDGSQQYIFTGHNAPIYCLCPHSRNNIHFLFSTSTDGKLIAWLYDMRGPRLEIFLPGLYCTRFAYSDDGLRLFSCGISPIGEIHLIEWNETTGLTKRTYKGMGRESYDVVQFDTTKNRFLVAGDEHLVKFWDMNNVDLMMTVDVGGGLPASPCVRFNKQGTLLAVSTVEASLKILANEEILSGVEQPPVIRFL